MFEGLSGSRHGAALILSLIYVPGGLPRWVFIARTPTKVRRKSLREKT